MIELSVNEAQLNRTVDRARERNIIIPTTKQQRNPELIPDKIKEEMLDDNAAYIFVISSHSDFFFYVLLIV